MRIHEIIFPNDSYHPAVRHRADPRVDTPPYRFDNDLSKLASAFTKHGAVKHFGISTDRKISPPNRRRRLELS
jgi:hypothetical protein